MKVIPASVVVLATALTVSAESKPAAPPAPKCNPERYAAELAAKEARVGSVPLTLLPQDRGDESPACLDGTPYGFFFQPSTTGSTKWTLSIEGGGWCYDEVDCYCRSKTHLGSSKYVGATGSCSCANVLEDGTMDTDCNCIYLPYSDGASFSGFVDKAVPVPGLANETMYFRGIKNLDGAIDFAMAHGMTHATEFVITGGSAGGLSTFLHADRVAARLHVEAPSCKKIRALPVVGYFLDHDNYKHTNGYPGGPNTPQWSTPGTGANYTFWMKYIYSMQNLSFAADGGLMQACQAKHANEPWLCFMSPHMNDVIETPFFMLNSKYDAWQLANIFQSGWQTHDEQVGVLQYGEAFLRDLLPVYTGGVDKNGAMITSCICHGCPWSDLVLEGKSTYEHYADWFYGKTTGIASMHIDPSLPNGNMTFQFSKCSVFPNMTITRAGSTGMW
eukprot:m.198822 g.198822  ORF g.198822 m.198822 type:complete len:445 (+) comp18762_c0_seq1:94-1428(+)